MQKSLAGGNRRGEGEDGGVEEKGRLGKKKRLIFQSVEDSKTKTGGKCIKKYGTVARGCK